MKRNFLFVILVLYLVILIKLIVFKYPSEVIFNFSNANLIPFKTIFGYISGEPTWGIAMRNILGNIIALIPFGFLLTGIYQKLQWKSVLLTALITGIILELLQILFKSGIFDVDDIILNFVGVFMGYLLFVYFNNIFRKTKI
ncbi:MAG: VanZ family protein [Candidatus Komeilibacteria bacterium]